MSYASLITNLPQTLSSSNYLAVLGSLGFHGLLFVVLPTLPFNSKSLESQTQRTVGLVELTPAEQSRLPLTSQPQVALPSFATQPSLLPPLPPPPSFPFSTLPPLPAPSSFQIAPPSSTSIPQERLTASLSPDQALRVPSLPNPGIPIPQQSRTTAPQFYRSNERLPQPYRSGTTWKQPPNRNLPSTNGLTPSQFIPPPPPNNLQPNQVVGVNPNLQNPNQPQQQKITAPTTLPSQLPERTKQELLARRQQRRQELDRDRIANNQPIPTPSPPESLQASQAREKLITALRQQRGDRNEISTAASQRNAQLQALAQRQERVNKTHSDVVTKAPIRENIKTCQKQLDRSIAYVGAVVNPQGKMVSGPDLVGKTGAADIAQAQSVVRNYPFKATGKTTNYNFAIEFKYDPNCPQPTATPSPNTQPNS